MQLIHVATSMQMSKSNTLKRERDFDEVDLADMHPTKCAVIHGVIVGDVSPVKQSRKGTGVRFFEGNLSDGKEVVRMVSFEPKLHSDIIKAKANAESVMLSNCSIQKSKLPTNDNLEVILNTHTNIEKSPKKFTIDESSLNIESTSTSDIASLIEIPGLAVNQHINVIGKVLSLNAPEKVHSKSKDEFFTKQDFVIGDSSATCKGVLWGTKIGTIKEGDSYSFHNVSVSQYNGTNYISLSSNSDATIINDIGATTMYEGDNATTNVYGEIIAVLNSESYLKCRMCKNKVVPNDTLFGECRRCGLKIKLSKCITGNSAKLLIENEGDGSEVIATAFDSVIDKLVEDIGGNTLAERLLQTTSIQFTINKANVITQQFIINFTFIDFHH